MKSQITFLVGVLLLCNIVSAQTPDWQPDASKFSNSMVMVGLLKVDGEESVDSEDIIGAFSDGEVRGVANLAYDEDLNRYVAFMIIYGNENGESITFSIYDSSEDQVTDDSRAITFEVNGTIGDLNMPYVWSNTMLETAALVSSFSLPGQLGNTDISGTLINIEVVYGTDLTDLVADFVISNGAKAFVDNEEQTSGVTSNDYTHGLTLMVRSEDEQTVTNYSITVTTASAEVTDIQLSNSSMAENKSARARIGYLSASDLDDSDHTFTLLEVSDFEDFEIDAADNSLRAVSGFDFELKNEYEILVKAEDEDGNSFQKYFTILIENVNEKPEIKRDINDWNVLTGTNWTVSLDLNNYFTDTDGDTLEFEWDENDDLLIEIESGLLTIHPADSFFNGLTQVNIKAFDADFSVSNSFSIYAGAIDGGLPPTQISISSLLVPENQAQQYVVGTLEAKDGDDINHTFSIVSQPFDKSFSINGNQLITTKTFDFEAEVLKTHGVIIKAVDNDGNSVLEVFNLTIQDVNEPPVFEQKLEDYFFEMNPNWEIIVSPEALASDVDGDSLSFEISGSDRIVVTTDSVLIIKGSGDFISDTLNLTVTVSDGEFTITDKFVVNLLLILGDDENEPFEFYPNPVKDILHTRHLSNNDLVYIFDQLGREVYKGLGTNNKIQISHLKRGLYLLKVQSADHQATYKIIKK